MSEMNMNHFFDIYISKDRLSASLSLKNENRFRERDFDTSDT